MKTWQVVAIAAVVAAPIAAVAAVGVVRGWFTFAAPTTTGAAR